MKRIATAAAIIFCSGIALLAHPPVAFAAQEVTETAAPEAKGPASDELTRIRDEDQADRQKDFGKLGKEALDGIAARDAKRLARVRALLEQDKVVTSEDFDNAALVFQHGETPDDALVAHELALASLLTAKRRTANNLPVLAEDRFLVRVGREQRFGAQGSPKPGPDGSLIFGVDEQGDLAVTDALRADLFMPPLALSKKEGPRAIMRVFDVLAARVKERMDPEWQARHKDRTETKRLEQAVEDAPAASREMAMALTRDVLKLYRADDLKTPEEYRLAARTLLVTSGHQPAGTVERQLLLAHELAMVAALRGDQEARPLVASTWDAFLLRIGQPQRYGTVFENGGDSRPVGPVATSASNTVRKILGIPPLKTAE